MCLAIAVLVSLFGGSAETATREAFSPSGVTVAPGA